MKSLVIVLGVLLLGGRGTERVHAEWAHYVRFTITDPDFSEGLPVFDSLYIDGVRGAAYGGHLGILSDPCEDGWSCIDAGFFNIAIPGRCELIRPDGSWMYADRVFKPVGILDPAEKDSAKIRHVIEVAGNRGKREAVVVYSEERGLESFATTEGTGRRKLLVHYYLTSAQGALAGGCVMVRGHDNRTP